METINRPKVGLALSGSGSRLVFYIGFLEELGKLAVPIDYIAAMSGASLAAAAFSCGRMERIKEIAFSVTKKQIMEMLPKGRGGMYSMDMLEEWARKEITNGMRMEEVKPNLGFVAADVNSGKQVVLSMGDIARAGRISCTLPLFFEPVKWGGKVLIDGGLLNVIPTDIVKQAGMDVIIGVNMRGTKHLFSPGQLAVKKTYNIFKKLLMFEYLESAWDSLNGGNKEEKDFNEQPQMLSVLGKSMDIALKSARSDKDVLYECDLMIAPSVKNYRLKNMEAKRMELYEIGRQTAQKYAPKIFEIINAKSLKV